MLTPVGELGLTPALEKLSKVTFSGEKFANLVDQQLAQMHLDSEAETTTVSFGYEGEGEFAVKVSVSITGV